ncbi:MAG TPA: GspMb/PilO family protein [Thermoanaerobaculia bacterium]|nr:GspMb/PilO family protein [Thermoanaerobaculia bacterium]
MIWQEKRVLLIILGVLLLGNGIFFFTYRVQYEARLEGLNARLAEAQAHLDRARVKRVAAQNELRAYDQVRADLLTLYDKKWATQAERFTSLINSVKKLASDSHLEQPKVYSFSRTEDASTKEAGGIGTSIVGINFTVRGTYQQLRELINRLELSNQFVMIDSIHLGAGSGADTALTLSLRLKTIFREPPKETQTASRQL